VQEELLYKQQESGEITPQEYASKYRELAENIEHLEDTAIQQKRTLTKLLNDQNRQIEGTRNALKAGLVQANLQSQAPRETLDRIRGRLHEPQWAQLDPTDEIYKARSKAGGPTGRKLLKMRQEVRANPAGYARAQEYDAHLGEMLNILHENLLTGSEAGKLTEVTWESEVLKRAEADSFRNRITLSIGETSDSMVHEFGHHLEYRNPKVRRRLQAFYEMRTRGKKAKGRRSYRKDEKFKDDKFFDGYCDKTYEGEGYRGDTTPTELLSMGLQALYNEHYFARMVKTDPQHLALILATIRGF
jgi:hypothetical protein